MTRFEALQIIAANLPETLYDKLGVNTLDNAAIEEVNTILDKLIAAEAKSINRRAKEKAKEKETRRSIVEFMLPTVCTCLTDGPATVKEIFARDEKTFLRCGITIQKLQYMLLHDWVDTVEVIKNGRNANMYKLKEGV